MKFKDFKIPSNRKFGFLFAIIFGLIAYYFHHIGSKIWFNGFILISLVFIIITLVNPDIFLPINKLWMKFGVLLGKIVAPIFLGLVFFGILTPIAVWMRLIGRDELKLKLKNKFSYWLSHKKISKNETFKKQF